MQKNSLSIFFSIDRLTTFPTLVLSIICTCCTVFYLLFFSFRYNILFCVKPNCSKFNKKKTIKILPLNGVKFCTRTTGFKSNSKLKGSCHEILSTLFYRDFNPSAWLFNPYSYSHVQKKTVRYHWQGFFSLRRTYSACGTRFSPFYILLHMYISICLEI